MSALNLVEELNSFIDLENTLKKSKIDDNETFE